MLEVDKFLQQHASNDESMGGKPPSLIPATSAPMGLTVPQSSMDSASEPADACLRGGSIDPANNFSQDSVNSAEQASKRRYVKSGMFRKSDDGSFVVSAPRANQRQVTAVPPSDQLPTATTSTADNRQQMSAVLLGDGTIYPLALHNANGLATAAAPTTQGQQQPVLQWLQIAPTKQREPVRYWTEEEHQKFLEGVEKFGAKSVSSPSLAITMPTNFRCCLFHS